MQKALEDLLNYFGLSPPIVSISMVVAFIVVGVLAIFYRENFFGFGDYIKRVFRAGKKIKTTGESFSDEIEKEPARQDPIEKESPSLPTVAVETVTIRFETERTPRSLDVLRVVHAVARDTAVIYSVPLKYHYKVLQLRARLEQLYEDYEPRFEEAGGKPSVYGLNQIKSTLTFVQCALQDLPRQLGVIVARLIKAELKLGDVGIAAITARVIELRITQVITRLASFQLPTDSSILLDYAGIGSLDGYVASVDGIPPTSLVSYRIQFAGDIMDREVFAPKEYGGSDLLILREYSMKMSNYVPPVSFLIEYAIPQMILSDINKPENWNFHSRCQSVYAKDLDGNYL